jgi:hypothetical protein
MLARTPSRSAFVIAIVWLCPDSGVGWALPPDNPASLLLTEVRARLVEVLKAQESAHAALLKSAPPEFEPGRDTNNHVDRLREIEKWRNLILFVKELTGMRIKVLQGRKRLLENEELLRPDTYDLFLRYRSEPKIPRRITESDVPPGSVAWLSFQIGLCDKFIKILDDAFDHEAKKARRISNLIFEETGLRQRIALLKTALAAVDFAQSQLK